VKAPVIIAMNHPNAFMDPVAFTAVCFPPRLKYMARGDAFKPGPITWLLEQIGIVPIFRIQDGGREGLKKNDDAYRRVNAFLKRRAKVIIFAEGICIQERRLRPLKKGLARMVFGAYEHLGTDELLVVPVGVNYSWPSKFRSNIFYNVGEPIRIKDFIDDYHQNPARAQNALLAHLEPKMKELITHINDPANDEAVFMVEQLCKKDWVK
jgi:1-acyl-sn-glycerol-3-phosphate acyltransferase